VTLYLCQILGHTVRFPIFVGHVKDTGANCSQAAVEPSGHVSAATTASVCLSYKTLDGDSPCLVKVLSDILLAIDAGDLAALVRLDLSAAFDTVDHAILLRRLETFGLGGTALHWFESYLVGRRQHVRTPVTFSSPTIIECGVPQGSVLSPILFLLYIADLQLLIEDRGLCLHHFADDVQIYGFCSPTPSSCTELHSRISECIDVVSSWMRSHRLQLNTAKTEVIWLTTGRRMHQLPQQQATLSSGCVLIWFYQSRKPASC